MLHEANIANVKAVIFDWDGTLADSQGSYIWPPSTPHFPT